MNRKVLTFNACETENIKRWIQNWLSINTTNTLKICDTNFGLDNLDYLMYIPKDCEIYIITTDESLDKSKGEQLNDELKSSWNALTLNPLPNISLFIFPTTSKDKLRNGLMVADKAGLHVDQSVNNFDKKQVCITVLAEDEIEELKNGYFQNLLYSGNWLKDHKCYPTILHPSE